MMELDRDFANELVRVMNANGWNTPSLPDKLPNPLDITFQHEGVEINFIIYARKLTKQARDGSEPSDHGRPSGEFHMQMIFEGDKKGRRGQLRFADNSYTLLWGFYKAGDDSIIAAYEPEKHRDYAYSTSLQVKQEFIEKAYSTGVAFQLKNNGETVVIFRLDAIEDYLEYQSDLHSADQVMLNEIFEEIETPLIVKNVLDQSVESKEPPELVAQKRKIALRMTARAIRSQRFKDGIMQIYDRCAICDFQYDYILDAAHIVPVTDTEYGTDTYANGLGLCPRCHRMFDKGFILVDETGTIHINPHYAEEYQSQNRAGSLEMLNQTLRKTIWLPEKEEYRPSPENLRKTFYERSR
ncbi:MAG: HNH endonuclease [Chloroflexota bacterium]